MNKRNFLRLATLTPFLCSVLPVFSQGKPDGGKADSTRPFRTVNAPEDGRRVLFFFDFSCPFCAHYHEPIVKWASTVPANVQTMFVPVVNVSDVARRNEEYIAAKCYYSAATLSNKEQMNRFVASVYESRSRSIPLASKDVWKKAVKDAGINPKKFGEALLDKRTNFQVEFAAKKAIQYALVATPSVGVGGKYVITPEDVLGDETMFFNILNGLTSEIL